MHIFKTSRHTALIFASIQNLRSAEQFRSALGGKVKGGGEVERWKAIVGAEEQRLPPNWSRERRSRPAGVIQLMLTKERIMGDNERRQITSHNDEIIRNHRKPKCFLFFMIQRKQLLACHLGGFYGNQEAAICSVPIFSVHLWIIHWFIPTVYNSTFSFWTVFEHKAFCEP